jgi:hypothetical protein
LELRVPACVHCGGEDPGDSASAPSQLLQFRVDGFWFRACGLQFRVFRVYKVQGLGPTVQGLGFRV